MNKILVDLILLAKAKVNNVDAKAQISIKMLPEYTETFILIQKQIPQTCHFLNFWYQNFNALKLS